MRPAEAGAPQSSPADRAVDAALLRSMPLPALHNGATKNRRGTVLVVGGSAETPGGALLAAVAALRMGAGKVRIATAASVATALAVAVPESRVIGLPETGSGSIARSAVREIEPLLERSDSVLLGTSALDVDETGALVSALIPLIGDSTSVIVDAGAIPVLRDEPKLLRSVADRCAVIPNPSEMAVLLDSTEDDVCGHPGVALDEAVNLLGTVVALRDAVTRTSARGHEHFVDDAGHPALATSGSGDVLAGALTGLAARGADVLRATLWSVHVHGRAGEHLGCHGAGTGTLARELLDVLPAVLRTIEGDRSPAP